MDPNISTVYNTDCVYFPNESYKCDVIVTIKNVTSSISIVACFFVLVIHFLFKRYHTVSQRLILNLMIAALIFSVFYVANSIHHGHVACGFFTAMTTYNIWTLEFTVGTITYNLFVNTKRINAQTPKDLKKFYIIIWVVPLFFALLPFVDIKSFGPAGPWCWLTNVYWQFSMFYVTAYVFEAVIIAFFIYSIVIFRRKLKTWGGLHGSEKSTNFRFFENHVKKLMAYPIAYLFLISAAFINRMYPLFAGRASYELMILMSITTPSTGTTLAIIYVITFRESFNMASLKNAAKEWTNSQNPQLGYSASGEERSEIETEQTA